MDIRNIFEKLILLLKKYRYAALVLVIGLILMAIPSTGNHNNEKETPNSHDTLSTEPSLEEKLSAILSHVDGAGDVQVILTVAAGEEVIYQTDDDFSANGESNTTKVDTVTVTDANRNQNGLIRQVNPPVYQGAIIVCEGADDPSVQLAMVNAVSKITGLGANRISVLKMK